jgi:SAM-dependent methyltransferase
MGDDGRIDRDHWARVAAEWVRWARAPNHDAFWAYRDAFAAFVGTGKGEALDVGCGEGRVARLLTESGYRVTATDAVAEMVEAARGAGSAARYAVAPADELPFTDGAFDLVVAYNMLMDVADLTGSVTEMARLLRPDGRLLVSVVHPLADFRLMPPDGAMPGAGSYFDARRFEVVAEERGLTMRFAGWARPLQDYVGALEAAGLVVASLREPAADCGGGRAHMEPWARMPLFLWMKAVRAGR